MTTTRARRGIRSAMSWSAAAAFVSVAPSASAERRDRRARSVRTCVRVAFGGTTVCTVRSNVIRPVASRWRAISTWRAPASVAPYSSFEIPACPAYRIEADESSAM